MITVNTFFSGTLNTVDAVIGSYVKTVYAQFIEANAGLITLCFTFYVMLLGYQFLNRHHHFTLSVMTKHIITMLIVYGMVNNWQLYHLFVYNVFTNEPGHIAKVLTENQSQSVSITECLDNIYLAIIDASANFFGQVSFSTSGIAFLFYAALVFIIGTLMCVFALLLFVYAKMMMAIALALGPIFILFLLWEQTKGLFAAWLRKLITLALIPIITSAILMLMLSVIKVTLPGVNQPAENLQFYGLAPFLGLSLATILILSQVLRICSSLGGGIALSSLSAGVAIVTNTLHKSGMASLGRQAINWSQNAGRQSTRNLYRGGK